MKSVRVRSHPDNLRSHHAASKSQRDERLFSHVRQSPGNQVMQQRLYAQMLPHKGKQTRSDKREELTHESPAVAQKTPRNRQIQRQEKKEDRSKKRGNFPWLGQIRNTWSAALRETPEKVAETPHRNTLADLRRGKQVIVIGHSGGWLHVRTQVNGKTQDGYVSQELIAYIKPYQERITFAPLTVQGERMDVSKAFRVLNRANISKSKGQKPGADEKRRIKLAIDALEQTGRYKVDRKTYQVSFKTKKGQQIQIKTIEDFILFVETVEATYPGASRAEIASEIRQLWFADANWEVMVASQGIVQKKGKEKQYIDIETVPNPIAKQFDLKQFTAEKRVKSPTGLQTGPRIVWETKATELETPLGTVTISHVMAGIDAALSGFPTKYPSSFLKARGHESSTAKLKYETLRKASQKDVRDFATWAGDIGQAYAEYLVARWVKGDQSADLEDFVKKQASMAQLLGDIHGYLALKIFESAPSAQKPSKPTKGEYKVSTILRHLYLRSSGSAPDYLSAFKKVTKKQPGKLKGFIQDRSLRFARPWYAKKARDARGSGETAWEAGSLTKKGVLEWSLKDFDKKHQKNEDKASKENKLNMLIGKFMKMLKG